MTTPTVRRIRERSTFRALRRPAGRAARGPVRVSFVPLRRAESGEFPQVGYVIGRRCGNAVARNRLRRRLRAAVQAAAGELAPGAYLVGSSPQAVVLGHPELVRTVREALLAAASCGPKPPTGVR